MKDSHVTWIGDIPEHWKVIKLKFLAEKGNSITPGPFGSNLKTSDFVNDGFKIYNQKDILDSSFVEDLFVTEAKFKKLSSFQVQSGDLLLTSRGSIGKSTIVPESFSPGIIHPCLIRVRINESKIIKSYVNLIINESDMFKENIRINSNGTVIDVIYGKTLKEIIIPVPEITEQNSILKFLDIKIKTINIEISKNKDLIKLLKEQRQSTINYVITKGLDDAVPMKDSGIPWIGEIPKHWNLKRVKYVAKIIYGNSLPDQNHVEGKIPVYGSNGIIGYHNESITTSETIIIGRKGSVGALNFSHKPCFPIDTAYFVDKNSTCYNLQWLFYMLKCLRLTELNKDSAVPGISREEIYNLKIPFYSKELKQIVSYLDKKTTKIDELISKVELQIEQLKEFKKSLISSTVTGKIQVVQA